MIRFEPRGCGRSDWDGQYDLATLLEDADAIRDAYAVDQWIVGGHSFGPNAALAYALMNPDRTLGLIGVAGGSVVNDREWSRAYHKGLDTVGEDAGGISFSADPDVNRQGNSTWNAYIKRPGLLVALSRMKLPAVFINAGNDIRPNWPTQQIAELLPNGRYIEIPDANHYIWLTHGEALSHALRDAIQWIMSDADEL